MDNFEYFLTMFLNPTFKSRVNINIEQRLKHLEKAEKDGFNPEERNKTAQCIDNDVEDWFTMIKNQFTDSKYKSVEQIERFFNEIDALIQIEEFIISLYIKEMQNTYIYNLNCYRKRILVLLSEKSKEYKTTEGIFYIKDEDKRTVLEKFNNYLEKIHKEEKNYVPPKFNTKLYELSQKRKNITIRIIICISIILAIFLYTYDKFVFRTFIVVVFLSIAIFGMNSYRRRKNREFWNKKTSNLIINEIEKKVENNIKR